MGTSSWTNHLYESFFAGCIPVILSDDFELPFQGTVPWEELSIKWPMHEVANGLYEHLRSVPVEKLRAMKAKVDEYACAFDFHRQLNPDCSPCAPRICTLGGCSETCWMVLGSLHGVWVRNAHEHSEQCLGAEL